MDLSSSPMMDLSSPSKKRQLSSSFNDGTPDRGNRSKRVLRDIANTAPIGVITKPTSVNTAPNSANTASICVIKPNSVNTAPTSVNTTPSKVYISPIKRNIAASNAPFSNSSSELLPASTFATTPSKSYHSSSIKDENGYVLTPRGLLTLCHNVSAAAASSPATPHDGTPKTPKTVIRRRDQPIGGHLGIDRPIRGLDESPFNAICGGFHSPVGLTSTPLKRADGNGDSAKNLVPIERENEAFGSATEDGLSAADSIGNFEEEESFQRIVETADESVCYENTFNGLSWISRLFDDDEDDNELETNKNQFTDGRGGVLPNTLDVPFNTVGRSAAAGGRRRSPPLLGLDNQFVREDSYRKREEKSSGRFAWRRRKGRGWLAVEKGGGGGAENPKTSSSSRFSTKKAGSTTGLSSAPKSPSGRHLKRRWRKSRVEKEEEETACEAVQKWLDRCDGVGNASQLTTDSRLKMSSRSMLSNSTASLSSFTSTSSVYSCLSVSSWSVADENVEDVDDRLLDVEDRDVETNPFQEVNDHLQDVSTAVEASESYNCSRLNIFSLSPRQPRQTHVTRFQFIPRHDDEVEALEGDAFHLEEEADDGWAHCVNLRTGARGVIPSVFLLPASFSKSADAANRMAPSEYPTSGLEVSKKERLAAIFPRFRVSFLGSVEVTHHRGDDVLAKAIREVASIQSRRRKCRKSTAYDDDCDVFDCWLEVHHNGIRVKQIDVDEDSSQPLGRRIDKGSRLTKLSRSVSRIFNFGVGGSGGVGGVLVTSKKSLNDERIGGKEEESSEAPTAPEGKRRHDYFFPLKNVSFCGFHPAVDALFAFITKHPVEKRFAAHVVSTKDVGNAGGGGGGCSSKNIAAALGSAFEKSYQNIIKTMSDAVTEDIYLE